MIDAPRLVWSGDSCCQVDVIGTSDQVTVVIIYIYQKSAIFIVKTVLSASPCNWNSSKFILMTSYMRSALRSDISLSLPSVENAFYYKYI